jgi:dihydroorotate dehydrogenase electron transfer subunit
MQALVCSSPGAAAVHTATVLDRRLVADDVVVLGLHAPVLAAAVRPGQFVMTIPPCGMQAAVALGLYEAREDRCSILFFVCGPRTRALAAVQVGASLDLVGPLGNGFDLGDARDVAIVAGGVGIASVLLAAREAVRSGARVRLYYGARTATRLVEAERFVREGCELLAATDDGSHGFHGPVTELLARTADRPDLILACGPHGMLRATADLALAWNVPAQLSLEETFACGVGGCWGCVVPLVRTSAQAPHFPPAERGGSDVVRARVCREGPVFWAHELRW